MKTSMACLMLASFTNAEPFLHRTRNAFVQIAISEKDLPASSIDHDHTSRKLSEISGSGTFARISPTATPSLSVSVFPSSQPSRTITPSRTPTSTPTFAKGAPSGSSSPSTEPSADPTTATTNSVAVPAVPSGSSFPSAEPSAVPTTATAKVTPTVAVAAPSGSSFPSAEPSGFPTAITGKAVTTTDLEAPSGSSFPSAEPSAVPSTATVKEATTAPSGSSFPSAEPSAVPSVEPSSVPSSEPSADPTAVTVDTIPTAAMAAPSGSSFPSGEPSATPTAATAKGIPTAATTPPSGSSFPSVEPSSIPSAEPSFVPTAATAAMTTPSGSSFPSVEPSAAPTTATAKGIPTAATAVPSGSSAPSAEPSVVPSIQTSYPTGEGKTGALPGGPVAGAPSTSLSPTEGPKPVSTSATVTIPCRSELDVTTQRVFETTAVDFINANIPTGSKSSVVITSVVITQQTLVGAQRRLRRQLQEAASALEIEMSVQGKQDSESAGDIKFGSVVGKVFAENETAFQEKLSAVSSFFRAELAYADSERQGGSTSSATGNTDAAVPASGPNIAVIVGTTVGVLSAVALAALLFVKSRQPMDGDDAMPSVDLLSWSTTTPTSADGALERKADRKDFLDKSPTDSEIYGDDDRYSIQGKLSPIEEDTPTKLEDCDINTPRNENTISQATPRGTKFVQMDFEPTKVKARSKKYKSSSNKILGDLENMEDEWEGQLDSKVDAVAETPRQNNLEKFKVGSKEYYQSNAAAATATAAGRSRPASY